MAGGVLGDRHRRERDDRDQQVEAEHRGDDEPGGPRDRLRGVLGLLGHVGDRLDPGVGDHPDRDPEREVAPGRGDAEVDVVDQDLRAEHQDDADPDQHDLGGEVGDREDQVEFRRLLGAADVDQGEGADQHRAGDHVARRVPERLPEDVQVMGHEVGRDRDRDRVVQHLAPGGDEADELVEGVAGEARGAAGLRVHHGRLGIGGGGRGEDQPGDHEGDRREAEGEGGGDAERVVDRGADVAVGGREQRADAVDAAQRFVPGDALGHLRRLSPARGRGRGPGRRGAAAERQGQLELGPQQLEHPQRARLAAGGEAPERGRPTRTASAPSASAIATSTPRRMPPSTSTAPRPSTASTASSSDVGGGAERGRAGARRGWRRRPRRRRARPRGRRPRPVITPLTSTGRLQPDGERLEVGPAQRRVHQGEGLLDRHRPLGAQRRLHARHPEALGDLEAGAPVALAVAAAAARRR